MDIDESLQALFHAEVNSTEDKYLVEIPKSEVESGSVPEGSICRVALLEPSSEVAASEPSIRKRQPTNEDLETRQEPTPPVSEGEQHKVQIRSEGAKGDGVAFIETGYAVFIPGTKVGDQKLVEIETVHDRYAFAEPVNDQASVS